jgi:autophagy-related protein 2
MASYFQAYFQATSMPKRLLQYALSRLEILDTDALGLDNLDIAWGKNSTFEFRDVGLRLGVFPLRSRSVTVGLETKC